MKQTASYSHSGLLKGFLVGTVLMLAIFFTIQKFQGSDRGLHTGLAGLSGVAAETGGKKLSLGELRDLAGPELTAVESDEYVLLKAALDRWLEKELLSREAKQRGISRKDLVFREIWSNVRVSNGDVLQYYSENQELFNQPFEVLKSDLFRKLRAEKYEAARKDYVAQLSEKHRAKIYLKKPKNFIPSSVLTADLQASGMLAENAMAGLDPAIALNLKTAPTASVSDKPPGDHNDQPSQGPEDAAVTLLEFSDFHCPFCSRVVPAIEELMKNYQGRIRRVWYHYPLPMHAGAERTHAASECAAEQGKFWEYKAKLFGNVGGYGDDASRTALAKELGLDEKQFTNCLTSGKYTEKIKQNINKGTEKGVRGTPAFFINGTLVSGAQPYETFKNAVENALHPGQAPVALPPTTVQPPAEVVFDDLKGRPAEGPESAPVTLVEFSDFHCPFCGSVEPTLDQLMENYKGNIRRIFRHFPLPFHQGADRTHVAAECAHEQGKFWEFKTKLFSNIGGYNTDDARLALAKELGLNENEFRKCMENGKAGKIVQADTAKGQASGVRGTPSFFLNGKIFSGAKPYEQFAQMVDEELRRTKK